jgi:AcrR family transcriptional regulator
MTVPRPGRREQVLEAAVALFSRKGFHGTSIREIAEESGMLSGSLYAHIASKEDLLYEIVMHAADQFMEAVSPIVAGGGAPSDKLRAAMRAHLRVVAGSLEAATIFLHEWKALSPQRRAAVSTRRDAYEALWTAILQEGVQRGEFRPVDVKLARLLVLSALNWLYEWYDPAGPLGPEAVADAFAGILLDGLRKEGAM